MRVGWKGLGVEVVYGGGGEGGVGGLGGGELGFEAVEDGHELVDAGDDAMLFGEGGNTYWHIHDAWSRKLARSMRRTFDQL